MRVTESSGIPSDKEMTCVRVFVCASAGVCMPIVLPYSCVLAGI